MDKKRNYQQEMEKILSQLEGRRPRLLLHSCCGPCSTSVIETLAPYFQLTVYYYNPNIHPREEYLWRKEEQRRYLDKAGIPMLEGDYDTDAYFRVAEGLEGDFVGGSRCRRCYGLRLEETGRRGLEEGAEYFASTLSVSPHKNSQLVNEAGFLAEAVLGGGIRWLPGDFKKKDGYIRSLALSQQEGMQRQDYCGCIYSIRKEKGEQL